MKIGWFENMKLKFHCSEGWVCGQDRMKKQPWQKIRGRDQLHLKVGLEGVQTGNGLGLQDQDYETERIVATTALRPRDAFHGECLPTIGISATSNSRV